MSFQKVSEDIDYELIPIDETDNEQAWDIRILRGDFTETVVRFGNISIDEENACLRFNFIVVSSPDETVDVDRRDLQDHVADILESVLENAMTTGSLEIQDQDED